MNIKFKKVEQRNLDRYIKNIQRAQDEGRLEVKTYAVIEEYEKEEKKKIRITHRINEFKILPSL